MFWGNFVKLFFITAPIIVPLMFMNSVAGGSGLGSKTLTFDFGVMV